MEDKNVWEVVVSLCQSIAILPIPPKYFRPCHIKQLMLSDNLWMVAVTVLQCFPRDRGSSSSITNSFLILQLLVTVPEYRLPAPELGIQVRVMGPKDPAAASQIASKSYSCWSQYLYIGSAPQGQGSRSEWWSRGSSSSITNSFLILQLLVLLPVYRLPTPRPGLQVRVMVQRIQQQHHKQFPYLTAVNWSQYLYIGSAPQGQGSRSEWWSRGSSRSITNSFFILQLFVPIPVYRLPTPGPGIQVRVMVQRIHQQYHKQLSYLTAAGRITCISAPHPRARDPDQSDGPEDPAAASQTAFWSLRQAVPAGLPDLKNKEK